MNLDGPQFRARHAAVRTLARHAPRLLRLEQLGAIHGTDKVDRWHTHLGQTNCAVYERYLSGWRGRTFTLLEIGVFRGASLRMWKAYFPHATICGLDIDPRAEQLAAEGFEIVVGSQTDPAALERVLGPHGANLQLVIDDGSHVNELTIATFDYVFPRLGSGALYVIEDTLCSYEPARLEWPGMAYNEGLDLDNRRADLDALIDELNHDCDLGGRWGGPAERTVAFVHTWPGLVIVGRA